MSAQLPPQPHLDVLKKQARQLLNDHLAEEAEAVARVEAWLADLPPSAFEKLTLRHAQQVLAREYGFTSWQGLVDHVGRPEPAASEDQTPALPEHYDKLARDLVVALDEGRLPAYGRLGDGFRTCLGDPSTGGEPLDRARQAVAGLSGCESWEEMAAAIDAARQSQALLINLEQLRAFEQLHRQWAGPLSDRLTRSAGGASPARADLAFTDRTSYGEYILSLAPPTWSYRISVEGFAGDIVLSLGPRLVGALTPTDPSARAAHLTALGEELADDLLSVWSSVAASKRSTLESHPDPWSMGVAPMYAVCGLQALEVEADWLAGGSALVEVCYPATAIQELLDLLPAAA